MNAEDREAFGSLKTSVDDIKLTIKNHSDKVDGMLERVDTLTQSMIKGLSEQSERWAVANANITALINRMNQLENGLKSIGVSVNGLQDSTTRTWSWIGGHDTNHFKDIANLKWFIGIALTAAVVVISTVALILK